MTNETLRPKAGALLGVTWWSLLLMVITVGTATLCWGQAVDDRAAGYPNRPVKLLVHVAPGAGSDVAARVVAEKLGEAMGQPVVVENRPGGGGRVVLEAVARAAPDGYTLSVGPTGALAIAPALYRKLGYDPIRDFAPVTNMVEIPIVLIASATAPLKTLSDVTALAKEKPRALDYASPGGAGTTTHLAMELLQSVAGIKLMMIPYKGGSDAHSDLISGRIPLMSDSLASALPHIRSGKVRAIAVFSRERQKLAPDIPTVAESGYPGFDATSWIGVVAPAKTPAPILDKLNREIGKVMELPSTEEKLRTLGFTPLSGPRARYAAFIQSEIEKWGAVVKSAGIEPE